MNNVEINSPVPSPDDMKYTPAPKSEFRIVSLHLGVPVRIFFL